MSAGGLCGKCGAPERDGFICRPCCGELERAIGDMTSLLHEVSVLALGQTNVYRANGEPKDHTRESVQWADERDRLPAWLRSRAEQIALPATRAIVNLDARDLLADAYDTLLTWACTIGADEISSRDVVAWLLNNMNDVPLHEDAAMMHDEITYLHRRIERAVDRSPARIFAGPCANEECKQADADGNPTIRTSLYAPWRPAKDDDEDAKTINAREFACDGHRQPGPGCGESYTWAERRPWIVDTIKESLVTVDDMLAALPDLFPHCRVPRKDSINGWVRSGRINAHGHNRIGEPTFNGGELLKLIEEYKPHTYAPRAPRKRIA